ncbi:MAG: hypothetical protein LKJ44_07300 [Bifidobacteriaceae bacterium]|jgi:hypothetical protein|nr:hypothetical protein [Bifidobacteriaceae bacterium]
MEDETTRTDINDQTFVDGQIPEDAQSPDSDYIPKNNHISRFEHHRLRIFLSLLLVYCATWIGAHALLRSAQDSYFEGVLDHGEAVVASYDLQNIHKDVLTKPERSAAGARPQQTEWDPQAEDSYSPFLWDIIITYLHVTSADQQVRKETTAHLIYNETLLMDIANYYVKD